MLHKKEKSEAPISSQSITRTIKKLENNIIEIVYFDNVEIDLDNAKLDYKLYDEFVGDKPVKKLIISGHFTNITSSAREYISAENKKRADKIIAEAIVVHSIAQRIFGNFYFFVARKNYPVKIFSKISNAKKWLNAL